MVFSLERDVVYVDHFDVHNTNRQIIYTITLVRTLMPSDDRVTWPPEKTPLYTPLPHLQYYNNLFYLKLLTKLKYYFFLFMTYFKILK